jgi:AmmeMemoRadiSam system protein A
MMTQADRQFLLDAARSAIIAHLTGLSVAVPTPRAFPPTTGVFVTLHKHGELRGCIGHLDDEPLIEGVVHCARAAASSDPRFSAVTQSELAEIDIEISMLGPLEAIASPAEVDIGRHGLIVEQGWQRGLLLPQVAVEWHWDERTFVEQTCRKAGLPSDAWQHGATLWRFEAEVFGERDDVDPTV